VFVVLDKVLTTREGFHKSEYSPKEERNKQKDDQKVTRFFVDSSKVFVQTSAPKHEQLLIANLSFCKWPTTEAGQASPHPYRELKPGPSDALLSARFWTSHLQLDLRCCFRRFTRLLSFFRAHSSLRRYW
jgi:hypothetical protein